MSCCACFTLPDGSVNIVCPNPVLVTALQAVSFLGCMAFLDASKQGLAASVIRPLYDAMMARTEQEAVRVIAERDAPRVAQVQGYFATDARDLAVMDGASIPASRRFRNAWRRVGTSAPAVEMSCARTQRMNEVRAERTPRLEKSDVDFLRAQETSDVVMQDRLKTYRQQLRDLPATEQPNVDAITTPENLAAWEPTWPADPA